MTTDRGETCLTIVDIRTDLKLGAGQLAAEAGSQSALSARGRTAINKPSASARARRATGRVVAPVSLSRWLLVPFGLLWMCGPCFADKGSCYANAPSNVSFGSLPLISLQNATTAGATTQVCPGALTPTGNWDFCSSIGVGSNSVSQTDRRMTNGSYYISYQLYTDNAYSNPYTYLGDAISTQLYNNTSGITAPVNIYGKILSSGALVPPGTYTDSYTSGGQSAISNQGPAMSNIAFTCTGNTDQRYWTTQPFTVSVTLSPSCSVTASPLNFGTVGVLTSAVNATTNLSVACTYTTPYTVSLSAGAASGATTTTRAMTLGASKVYYSLYQNAAMTQNWGNNIGVDTVAGTGTGSAQSIPVYGQVPAQTTPTIGSYSDTILVTVNY